GKDRKRMTAGLLEAQGLTLERGGRPVLWGVDLSLHAGESLLLVGPNGAGESSLLLVLGGLLRPTRGKLLFGGTLSAGSRRETSGPGLRRLRGLVLEAPFLYPQLSGRENLLFYARLFALPSPA